MLYGIGEYTVCRRVRTSFRPGILQAVVVKGLRWYKYIYALAFHHVFRTLSQLGFSNSFSAGLTGGDPSRPFKEDHRTLLSTFYASLLKIPGVTYMNLCLYAVFLLQMIGGVKSSTLCWHKNVELNITASNSTRSNCDGSRTHRCRSKLPAQNLRPRLHLCSRTAVHCMCVRNHLQYRQLDSLRIQQKTSLSNQRVHHILEPLWPLYVVFWDLHAHVFVVEQKMDVRTYRMRSGR